MRTINSEGSWSPQNPETCCVSFSESLYLGRRVKADILLIAEKYNVPVLLPLASAGNSSNPVIDDVSREVRQDIMATMLLRATNAPDYR